ncbi:MAG: hypothetical protein P4L92_00175 [Rudaea sp.]|nr:hypothetical protein [Rudaea sp.]
MPKKKEKPIPDALLISNDVWSLDPTLPLSARQVALITNLSVSQLKERRRTRPPHPPLPLKVSGRDKKGEGIWYPLGEVLAHKQAQLTRTLPVIVRSGVKIDTFATFMQHGLPTDQWVFAHTLEGQPVDFFASLRLGKLIDPNGECGWLTLEAYLIEMNDWTAGQRSDAQTRGLSGLRAASDVGEVPACPRCGRAKTLHHRCSI